MQAKGGKQRRGVQKHRHMRGAGVTQPCGDKKELQREQCPHAQTGAQRGAIPGEALAAAARQQVNRQRGKTRANGDLQHRRHIRLGGLDCHLLHSPDGA